MRRSGHIFLSYRSVEAEFALRLAADLKNAGVQLWMDRLDIQPGDDWNRALVQSLNTCSGLIAVLSPAYVNSDYCKRELARAGRMRRQIFPVLLQPIAETDWPLEIERLQQIDFTAWQDEEQYYERLKELLWVLHKRASEQTGSAPGHETRYLNTLIAELEARQGVISYVELAGYSSETVEQRPQPASLDSQQLAVNYTVDPLRARENGAAQPPENATQATVDPATPRDSRDALSSIREATEKYPRFVLIGPHGSGKTTTLQRLALEAARARLAAPHLAPLPLLLPLASWEVDLPFVDFLRSHWLFEDDLFRSLQHGRTLLYLDGLNEMGATSAARAAELRDWLQSPQAPERVILTCRANDYHAALDLNLPILHAEPMDDARVRQFVIGQLGDVLGERFLRKLEPANSDAASTPPNRHSSLSRMAHNPFLLQAMLTVHSAAPSNNLPQHRGALLQQLVDVLWERDGARQTPGWRPQEEMLTPFARLAFAMIDEDLPQEIPATRALEHLGDARLLPVGAAAQLLEVRSSRVRFRHQLIQEYFAARGLEAAGLPTRLRYPEWDESGQRVARKWDAVMIVLCGLATQADPTIQTIASVDPFLAERCLQTGIQLSDAARNATIEALQEFLTSEVNAARLAAAQALGRLAHEGAIQPLITGLRDRDWAVRLSASEALHRIQQPALPGLIDALRDWDHVMSEAAGTALRQIGEPAVSGLLEALRDEDWRVRRGAAWALGELADAAAVPGLVAALADEDCLVRRAVAVALGWIRDPAAVPELLRALYDDDWRVRTAAAEALGWLGSPAVAGLLDIVNRPPSADTREMRRLALEALGVTRDARALTPLLYLLVREDEPSLRAAAANALGNLADPRAAPYLIRALTDERLLPAENERVCDYAAEALAAFPQSIEANQALTSWREQQGLSTATPLTQSPALEEETLGLSASPAELASMSVDSLLAQLQQGPAQPGATRQSVVTMLGERREPRAIPALLEALKDENGHVRWAAVRALSAIEDEQAVPALLAALRDEEITVIDAAAEGLGRFGKAAQAGLIRALRERRPAVRGAAAEALGRLGHSKAVRPLRKLLNDRARSAITGRRIGELAAEALERIGSKEALAALRKSSPTGVEPPPVHALARPDALPARRMAVPVSTASATSATALAAPSQPATLAPATLVASLLHSDGMARQEAARQLRAACQRAARGEEDQRTEWLKALQPALTQDSWFARWIAVEGLALILADQPRAAQTLLPLLEPLLKDPSYSVRLTVARTLTNLGDGAALQALTTALDDESPAIQEVATQGLGHIGDERATLSLLAALGREDPFVRRAAASALLELATRGALPTSALLPLREALANPDDAVRLAAAKALAELDASPHLETITDALIERLSDAGCDESSGERVSDAAAAALARIGNSSGRAALERWRGRQPTPT
ncbi:MAG: HEAT repeat domain-containing protein [Chloroflexi bacterium]|nr:HEAT repeat domain-containing protein [Chloroflexota bacterium]